MGNILPRPLAMLSLLVILGISLPQADWLPDGGRLGCTPSSSHSQVVTAERFSLTYPVHWLVTRNDENYVILYNQSPPELGGEAALPNMIKTDASFEAASLRDALRSYYQEPGQLQRVEAVTVNGRSGVRIWYSSEGLNFPNMLTTIIAVSEQEVAFVASYYSQENPSAEATILQVHDSLTLF